MSNPANDPLPWRPFHPQPLSQPAETYLFNSREDHKVRAIMEIIERRTRHVARDMAGVIAGPGAAEGLLKHAGTLDAYLDLHRHLTRAVDQSPTGGKEEES